MAVTVDVTGTVLVGASSVTSINYTGITVGAGSNRALIVTLGLGNTALTSGWTATWDSGGTNQAMTLLKSQTHTSGANNDAGVIFGLRNPTSGLKTLALSWTTAQFPTVEAISFNGVDQTSDAAAFPNAISNNTATINVASAVGNIPVSLAVFSSLTAFSQTNLYFDATSSGADSSASRAAGAASVTFTVTTPAGAQSLLGVDVAAAGAADVLMPQIWI